MTASADPVRDQLCRDIDAIARLRGSFTLRSGQVSDAYFDKYRFEADPALLRRGAEQMVPLLPADTEVLGGLELGGKGTICSATRRSSAGSASKRYLSKYSSETCPERSVKRPRRRARPSMSRHS